MSLIIPPLKTVEDWIGFAEKINPRKEPLTVERLKTYPGFGHCKDDDAADIVRSIEQLAVIIFETYQYRQNVKST
ncbi:MAG TPA: hypothetical protein VGM30_17080 [Puia sp.]|jgi:hypothetical protein